METNEIVKENPETKKKISRILAIDRFRGLAVFCMIFFQLLEHFDVFGWLTRISSHSLTNGIIIFQSTTIADLIAPMFMFAIALTYKLSYDKRVELYGKQKTNVHFVQRNLALIGVGALLYTINVIIDMMSGSVPRVVDYIMIGLFALTLLSLIIVLIFNIKPLKKYKPVAKQILGFVVAVMGLTTIVYGAIDFVSFTADVANYHVIGYWMVLQSLGFAGLVALPFINSKAVVRAISGVALLGVYTAYYHLLSGAGIVNAITQGGFIGGFGWAVIILIGSAFAELYSKNKKNAYISTILVGAIAISMYFLLPIAKAGVRPDPTYLAVTIFISMIVFLIFDLFNFCKSKFDPLAWWGKYPFLLYMLEFGVIGLFIQIAPESIIGEAPLWLAIVIVASFITLFTTIVYLLSRKNKKINL